MKYLYILILLSISAHTVFADDSKHKHYIDFQVQGVTFSENQDLDSSNNGIVWTSTNFEINFNFNKYFAINTMTSLSNRYNGLTRPHTVRAELNGAPKANLFFDNHGLTSRLLALAIHNDNTEVLIGKIRPNVGIGNNITSSFNNDWTGLYGTMIPGGYTNSNKIGIQLHADVQMFVNATQIFEVSLFKNDTTDMGDAVFANNRTFGHSSPYELRNFLTQRIAGDTNFPASFSIFFVNKLNMLNNNTLNYAMTFRKQAVDSDKYSFGDDENTYLASIQYEKQVEASTIGVFGEFGIISNAHGVESLRENYFTFSGYLSFDNFTTAFVHNTYRMNGRNDFSISTVNFSQNQVSFGYKITPDYKVSLAYRALKDHESGRSGQGVGLGFAYSFGTRPENDNRGRVMHSVI